jgi:hypothetical protein
MCLAWQAARLYSLIPETVLPLAVLMEEKVQASKANSSEERGGAAD